MTNRLSKSATMLDTSFYRRSDVTLIARELIGKFLCTRTADGPVTAGRIVETEAYAAQDDRACHASGYNKTKRNEAMFREGGIAYIYLCYGIHNLFNVVTNVEGEPEAVLIRAIAPTDGEKLMLTRREHQSVTPKLAGGPGRLTQALGINRSHYGASLQSDTIWIEDRGRQIESDNIITSPRIGVGYAGKDAEKPWRFTIKDSKWVSR
jgi:DNA-3-methyladenine glycosylase